VRTDPKVLILYGTSHGQTAKIAGRLRDQLQREGARVLLTRGDDIPPDLDPDGYDVILVGASIVLSGHQKYVGRWVREHVDLLNRVPSAFFSVSGSAGSDNPEEREAARKIVDKFLDEAGWQPRLKTTFAGAIMYTKYNPLVRWVMKRISRKEGRSTDTSRDHEYTDWAAVEAFGQAVLGLVAAETPAGTV
jgi:menaquinone-dependent protoporphyrinogen oxidase